MDREAWVKAHEQLPEYKSCKCSLRTKLVGDGCEICNPLLARDLTEEENDS